MYDHHIEEMIDELEKHISLSFTRESAKNALCKYWEDKVAFVWNTDDAFGVAEQDGLELTQEEAIDVLYWSHENHDANHGTNWDTLRLGIEILGVGKPRKETK